MLAATFVLSLVFAVTTHSVEGTLMSVETNPPRLMANVNRQFQTFPVTGGAVIEREACSATKKIPLEDLTPGEFVKLDLDPAGHVRRAHAIVNVETAKVRSVSGSDIVLEDGRTLTVSSVLRFFDAAGRQSSKVTSRPGDTLLLYKHPQTANVYRVNAVSRSPRKR